MSHRSEMSERIEKALQAIGQSVADLTPDATGRRLLYSEVEPGVISADLFYVTSPGQVRHRFSPQSLKERVAEFWDAWRCHLGNTEWRAMAYVIDGGQFSVDLTYLDQMDPVEGLPERRPRAVKEYFGAVHVEFERRRSG